MTDISDNQYLTTLQGAGDVPATASQALQDPNWAWLFEVWAQEPRVGYVNQFMAQLARMCVDPGVDYMTLRMEAYTGQREELYSNQTNNAFSDMDNEQPARASLLADCAAASESVWPAFRRFILIQQGDTDGANAEVDWAKVYADADAVNQPTLKNLSPGDSVTYWQAGGLVLLGDRHDPTYYDLVGGKDSPTGTVTMSKKGGFLDTGKISVYNSPDPNAFDEAIARFSKKNVVHGQDYELEDDEDDTSNDGAIVRPEDGQFANQDDAWAWYQQCADAISYQLAQAHDLNVALSAQGFLTYKSGSGGSITQAWPELLDALESADLRASEVQDTVDGLMTQNGWWNS